MSAQSELPEGYEEFCPDRFNRRRFTPAEIAEMELREANERLRREVRRRGGWR